MDAHGMAEHIAQALDDRQAEPKATPGLTGFVSNLMILVEYGLQFRGRNADSAVPNLHAHGAFTSSTTEQDFARLGELQRVREQIADHLFEQARVASQDERAGDDAQAQGLCLGVIIEFVAQSR